MSLQLERATGPDCPECGCNATHLFSAGTLFGRAWARFQCDACEHLFSVGGPGPKATAPLCPNCGSDNTFVASGGKKGSPKRNYKCRSCDYPFPVPR